MFKTTFRVLGLDPRIGYAIVDYDQKQDQYKVVYFYTANKDKLEGQFKLDAKRFTKELAFLASTKAKIIELMNTFNPTHAASEDAFNYRFVAAFKSLAVWISTVSLVLYQRYELSLYLMSPTAIKLRVANGGHTDKDGIKEAILSRKNLSFDEKLDLDELTEHSCDAIACALAYLDVITGKVEV